LISAPARGGARPDRGHLCTLRHTSIVRAILANVPLRVVAANHDTSVVMIERNYSAFITDHSDAISRAALSTRWSRSPRRWWW
jgi:hypothetical protein